MIQKRNLTKEKIIQVAFLLSEEIGLNKITFTKISEKLDIKYPSLYNYFDNMDNLKIEMVKYFLNNLNLNLMKRLIGKSGKDAIKEFAYTYRDFAFKNRIFYELFMTIGITKDDEIHLLVKKFNNILYEILNFYIEDKEQLIYKSRSLRSLLHGFVSMNFHGYFHTDVNLESSFAFMVDDFILSLSPK
ncbi:TetR/AcrR family transcriptional regulator [Clostridium beijerinckii]|uniref:TetR/AcrR family transcriptional regulator n=1 Tax=Clostridium beijerinckii TaxID=1520 RepID=UPI0009D2DEB7|nr:TetR/AcrR family transcriptional regulator [Clostridium beijerinckii]NRT76060.1 AcrR family transcriptional regulator [Clostridium beijerinckii]OOM44010.1 hypothetical protein CBEIJ_37450 [Clostridium beijerinckii]